jgi:hypothetical protein
MQGIHIKDLALLYHCNPNDLQSTTGTKECQARSRLCPGIIPSIALLYILGF